MGVSGAEGLHNSRRRGSTLIYTVIMIPTLIGMASLCVDLGRVQTAKSELQDATDAAARYASEGLLSVMNNTSGASANATASFADNTADGQAIAFDPTQNLQTGIWDPATRTFTPATVAAGANAVQVTMSLTLGTSSHPLTFLSIFNKQIQVTAKSVAMISGQDVSTLVTAKGNPWLAGAAAGTVSTDFRTSSAEWDTAGSGPNVASSPAMVTMSGLGMSSGGTITFDGVTGGTDYSGSGVNSNADGIAGSSVNLGSATINGYDNYTSAMRGLSNCHAPINSMVAVFLDDNDPSTTAAPLPLDFSATVSRDFVSLSPQLKQVFFVGDGRRASGEVQQFVVPTGATRLFIGNLDGWQYNNNLGGYNLTIHAIHKVTTVQMR